MTGLYTRLLQPIKFTAALVHEKKPSNPKKNRIFLIFFQNIEFLANVALILLKNDQKCIIFGDFPQNFIISGMTISLHSL